MFQEKDYHLQPFTFTNMNPYKNFLIKVALGAIVFMLIGLSVSCTHKVYPTYHGERDYITPNPHQMNEGEYIKYKKSNAKY